ncbi:MAG: MFS transporter [Gemmatimonadota bacterium]|nr:MFS transporter [Gemmatimonadota bacterium]MDH5804641.1 MFS transporter [Gemmatimonadota bacterium]
MTESLDSHRLGAFSHRNFRLYFGGHLVSLVGWAMHAVAQPWLVLSLTDSPFYVGVVGMLQTAPILFLSLYGGFVADRFPRRRVLLLTQSFAMITALALAGVVFAERVLLIHVMIAATLLGVASAFDIPGRQAFLSDLVGKRDLMSAIAFNSAAFNSSRVIGPAVAGVLIGTAGVGVCFLLNGMSYLALVFALIAMRLASSTSEPLANRSPIREGLKYVARDRRMRALILMIAVTAVFALPFHILMPVLARDVLGLGAAGFGWMVSATAVGALTAALGLAVFPRHTPKGKLILIAAPLFGVSVSALGWVPSVPLVLLLLVVVGFLQVVFTATTNTFLQTIARDELRGRVMSVYTVAFMGMMPIGALLGGAVAERFGVEAWFTVSGLVCAVILFQILRMTPEIRTAA